MSDIEDPTAPGHEQPPGSSDTPERAADAQSASPASRQPSAAAMAASRARRIGGRPMPGPSAAGADEQPTSTRVSAARRASSVDTEVAGQRRPGPSLAGRLAGRREVLRPVPTIVLAVAVLVLLSFGVIQSHGVWWGKRIGSSTAATRTQVLAAAKTCAAAIVSYDYRALPASEQAGQACTTGAFKTNYTRAMETTVKTLAPQSKTVQTFQVAKAGIEHVSPDGKQWVVLIYGQQSVTNSSTAKGTPRLDILNVEATLDRVGNAWLISDIR